MKLAKVLTATLSYCETVKTSIKFNICHVFSTRYRVIAIQLAMFRVKVKNVDNQQVFDLDVQPDMTLESLCDTITKACLMPGFILLKRENGDDILASANGEADCSQ